MKRPSLEKKVGEYLVVFREENNFNNKERSVIDINDFINMNGKNHGNLGFLKKYMWVRRMYSDQSDHALGRVLLEEQCCCCIHGVILISKSEYQEHSG